MSAACGYFSDGLLSIRPCFRHRYLNGLNPVLVLPSEAMQKTPDICATFIKSIRASYITLPRPTTATGNRFGLFEKGRLKIQTALKKLQQ
ncbi:hypothetical protein l13_11460 [Neisseria weaveri ATCC 51223]|nr:hypothetical protein l13_11460 [Neisseria weaveri ATCC 51223]